MNLTLAGLGMLGLWWPHETKGEAKGQVGSSWESWPIKMSGEHKHKVFGGGVRKGSVSSGCQGLPGQP